MSVKVTVPNTSSDSVVFGSANTPTAAEVVGIDSGSSNGQLAFKTTASGTSTERMRIDASGNVGIGTSSPSYKLQVSTSLPTGVSLGALDSSSFVSNGIAFRSLGNQAGISGTTYAKQIFAGGSPDIMEIYNGANYPLVFGTNATERMRIDSSGNVLVGTTSQATTARFTLKAANTGYGGIGVVKSDSSDYWTQNVDSQVGYTFGKNGADFWHAGRGGSNNCVSVNGSWVNSSDVRLKENIKTIPNALENVCKLRGVEFDRKNNGTHEVGLIAQEVQKIYPETIEDNGNYLGLNYGSLIGPLVEAIKQLKAELDTVKSELATLKGTV